MYIGEARSNIQSDPVGLSSAPARARDLIFFGYSGTPRNDGRTERDRSFELVAFTLKEHLLRRFPSDDVQVICAWHKNAFLKTLLASPPDPNVKIRQIHYVGHGSGGGLFFGYRNKIAVEERAALARRLDEWPLSKLSDDRTRAIALAFDAGLLSGLFTDAMLSTDLAAIKAQFAPGALLHIWGCFAGAPCHTFDASDDYWRRFNRPGVSCTSGRLAASGSVDGVARHIARTLGINVTAVHDPRGVHGMTFCHRNAHGAFLCGNVRPARMPHWLWPAAPSVRWITYDATGNGSEPTIRFMGELRTQRELAPGRPPAWLSGEIPPGRATTAPTAPPTCAASAFI